MMYQAYQAHVDWMSPLRGAARAAIPMLTADRYGLAALPASHQLAAALEVMSLAEVTHHRRPFGITEVEVVGERIAVREEAVVVTPFATLLRFAKDTAAPQPKVLIAAPMSGHFATLLRETVRTTLRDHDVYITDWHNARDVPLAAGRFGLDEYVEHLMQFLAAMGPGAHLMSICQPCVAALAAAALMAEDDDPAAPLSLTLMAGPIDCRVNPTEVNKLANDKPIAWFERHLISHVPLRYPGAMRRVYPGFVQLSAFMNMNRERHVASFREMYENLLAREYEKVQATREFYEEYFAVADLAAEFYLETIEKVFQTYDLARGALTWRGRKVDPAAIRRMGLLTVEGERDDICAIGQTLAAQDLCTGLKPYRRTHYLQPGVGHYGVFSGRRWDTQVYPMVRNTIQVSA